MTTWLEEIKESAHHIDLPEISVQAGKLSDALKQQEKRIWYEEEWSNYIQSFVLLFDRQKKAVIEAENTLSNQTTILLFANEVGSLDFRKQLLERQGYKIFLATSVKRTIQLFYDYRPDLILLDVDGAENDVMRLIKRLSKRAVESFIPFIVMGEEISDKTLINMYDEGTTDVIDKSTNPDVIDHIIANRMRQKQSFKAIVFIDELTKAYNRTFLQQIWQELFNNYRAEGYIFSLVLIDLDFFKQVNDEYGHAIGDQVLKSFARCILENKREQDYFIRYGGEEFILLMTGVSEVEAGNYIEQILKKFSVQEHQSNEQTFTVSFSAGVSEIKSGIATMRKLIERSDQALYYAKANGRACVELYRPAVREAQLGVNFDPVLKLALIDDDGLIRRYLEDRLVEMHVNRYRVEVTTFEDGETFLASGWHRQQGDKLILLDIILPKMDGLEVLLHLREAAKEKDLGIMMLTGRQKNRDIIKALELGADDYITKPFSFEQLEERIKRFAERLFMRD